MPFGWVQLKKEANSDELLSLMVCFPFSFK